MANIALAYPNRFDAATVSGQGWLPTLPITYLKTRQIAQVSRSHWTMAKFYASFAAAIDARLFGSVGHNLTTAAKKRVRGYSTDPRPMIDRSTQVATLDIDFETFPASLVTCTRSGTATYFDSNLVLQTAAANTPRFSYDPNTGKALGLLAEGAATNLLLWSRDLTNAAWTKTNMTAANATVTQQRTTGAAGWVSALVRLVSGVGNVQLTGDNFGTTTAMALTTSWKRFWISTAASPATFGIKMLTNGDVIEVDFTQMEAGSSYGVSSPIPTTTASASRNGDSLTIAIPSHLQPNGGSGSWVIHMRAYGRFLTSSQSILTVSGAGSTMRVRHDASGYPTVEYNSVDAQRAPTLITTDTDYLIAASYASASHSARCNGSVCVGTGSPTTTAGLMNTININPPYGGYAFRRLTFFPSTQDSSTLVDFSTPITVPAPGYDSGLVDAWPAAWVPGTTAEQRSGARDIALVDAGANQSFQYWRIDLVDTGNAAGFVQLGREFMGSAWQPITNMSYGATIGYQARESVSETDSGAEYFVSRPNRRVIRFSLDWLTEAEAMEQVMELQRQLGTTGELLVAWDLDDTLQRPRRTFLARMRTLGELTNIFHNIWTARFELGELL